MKYAAMKGDLALSRAARRSHKADVNQRAKEMRTEAFKWAWDKLEGWGVADGDAVEPYDFTHRLEQAKVLALHAVAAPMWRAEVRKEWPAATEGALK